VHAGLVSYQGEKMSKSRGNLVFVSKLLAAGTDPMAIRLAILRHHYRSEWEWTDELLDQAKADLARWRTALSGYGTASATNLLNQIRDAVANDLDTPRALKAVDDFVSSTLAGDRSDLNGSGLAARALDRILGIAL
jgi:L-cysteine:1D-myo-inositol 2-amino-2-deoxy-alpha-D-glucopyranoside ligase